MQLLEPGAGSEEADDFPGYTEWNTNSCGCCLVHTVPSLRQVFWGHWEVRLIAPFIAISLSFVSFLILTISVLPSFGQEGRCMFPVFLFLYVMFTITFIRIITDGPGYYPFYWGANNIPPILEPTNATSYHDSSPAGIISCDEQFSWAIKQPKPPRSILSKKARRMVLRPDHLSTMAATWIGKRNHKFFILANFYSCLYFALFVIYIARKSVMTSEETLFLPFLTVCGVCAAAFFLLSLCFLVKGIIDIFHGRTSWEEWEDTYTSRGVIRNIEDVCGPGLSCCYFCPISPWKGMSNEEISLGYEPYPDDFAVDIDDHELVFC